MDARSPAPIVLVADAEPYICRVLEAKLTKDDRFQVISAATGADAYEAALADSFDVILWDMRLRGAEDLLPRLRALCPYATLFLMTTDDRPMLDAVVARLDVAGLLIKPFGLDTLVEQILRALSDPKPTPAAAIVDLARVGQMLTLTSPGGPCQTRVLEQRQDTFLVIGAPRVSVPYDFAPGLNVRADIKGEDALYTFQSRLTGMPPYPVACWEVTLPEVIRREQRRRYSRIPVHLAIVLEGKVPDSVAEEETLPGNAHMPATPSALVSGIAEDISLGGCALVSERPMSVGTDVTFDLFGSALQEAEGIAARGRIVRADLLPHNMPLSMDGLVRYRLAVEFTTLDEGTSRRLRALIDQQE